jgi:outer membrane protein OmpA-like peptidoglycan-associated protein
MTLAVTPLAAAPPDTAPSDTVPLNTTPPDTVPLVTAPYQGFSVGLGAEANTVTLSEEDTGPGTLFASEGNIGLGAQFTVEGRLNRFFALDFHGTATTLRSWFSDFCSGDTFLALEALLYLRFYPFAPKEMRRGGVEFFLGAGGGVLAVLNESASRNSRSSPEAGGIAGFRFRLGSRFYLEPYARASFYPVLFGAGITAGFRFPVRPVAEPVVKAEPPVEIPAETVGPPVTETFVLIFGPNVARFDGLDDAAIRKNEETMSTILGLLEKYPAARLLIEGYANPVLGTQKEEHLTLWPLSERRAAYIARAFIDRGVAPERLISVGSGGNRPVATFDNRENWGWNRRAEIRFIW